MIVDTKPLMKYVACMTHKDKDRFYDISDSLTFAVEIENFNKINFEFQNLCDLMDDTDCDGIDDVFDMWKEITDEISVI